MSDKFGEIFLKFKIIVYKKIDCENCGKALENLKIQEKHIVLNCWNVKFVKRKSRMKPEIYLKRKTIVMF